MKIGYSAQRDEDSFKLFDLLLIVGLTLAPMTSFRVWRVGPAEVLCLLWGIRSLLKWRFHISDTLRFFALFLATLGLGSAVCSFVAPGEVSITGLLTWLYLGLIAISIYEGLNKRSLVYVERLLRMFSVTAILWYLFLFVYSRTVSRTFLGAPLWYSGRRFSGGATNPHQIAVLMCALCFVFFRQVLNKRRPVLNAALAAASLFILVQTDSSTGIMAVFLAFIVSLYLILIYTFPRYKAAVASLLTVVLLLVGLLVFNFLYDNFINWVSKDSNGIARFGIFSEFPACFVRSPIVGLGPGTHGRGGTIEFHNTYLEIAAASGVVGFTVFAIYSVRIFRKTMLGDWRMIPILVAMYGYGLAGFAMRRLVYWGVLSFLLVIAEKRIAQQQEDYSLGRG